MRTQPRFSQLFAFGLVVIFFGMLCSGRLEANSNVLDGKTFMGQTGKMGKDAGEEDEIQFQDGKFYSVGCEKWGFGKAEYQTEVDGDIVRFEATTLSPKHGKIVWKGTVQGDQLQATYLWTKERWYWKDAHQEKWFKGNLKE